MPLDVDSPLALEKIPAHPSPTLDGSFLLYVYSDGQLYGLNNSVPGPGGSSSGGVPGKVWGDTFRPPLLFFDTVATSAQAPTAADLGVANFVVGDVIVREADFEMFEYEQTGQFSQGIVDLGVKWGGVAGVPAGGTTGQVLAKRSNTDFDTQWVAAASGGGGTQSVSNVASMNTAARMTRTAAYTTGASQTFIKVPFDTATADPGNHLSVANSRYVCPSTGWYQVNGVLSVVSTASGQRTILNIFKNGVIWTEGGEGDAAATTEGMDPVVADLVFCNAGDYLELYYWCTATGLAVQTGSSSYFSVVQVDKALAPTSGGVSAGTAARTYCTTATQMGTGGAFTKVPFNTISSDPGGHINLTNSRYVAPSSGLYWVGGEVYINASAASQYAILAIFKNGVEYTRGNVASSIASGVAMGAVVDDIIPLNAGDYVELWAVTSTPLPLTPSGAGAGATSYMSVTQVDQALTPTVQPTTAARAYRTAAFNMPAGAWTKIPVDTVGADPGGHISLTNSRYVCPVTGYYEVSVSVAYTPSVASLVAAACYKNGTAAFKSLVAEAVPTAGVAGASASDIVFCNAGDYLELYGLSGAAAGLSIENTVNFISVVQVDQPIGGAGGNAVTPTTGARMYRNAAFTPAANTWTKVPLDSVGHDSGGHTDIANSRYICPSTGWYQVNANASLNVGTAQTATTAYVGIAQNGTRVATGGARGSDNFNEMICTASDLLWCAAGDVLELDVFSGAGSPLFLGSNGNYLSVVQVDAPTPVAPNTGAKAYGATTDFGTSISPGTWTKIHLTTAVNDPGGHFDLVTAFVYKATAAGWYSVIGNVAATVATAGTQNLEAAIYKNGSFYALGSTVTASEAVGALLVAQVADLVYLNPGDTLALMSLAPGTTGGMSLQTANAAGNNYLSVVKVDQPQYANNPTVVTALPATPYDGQEIYFVADAANGVKWHLRYNAGSSSTHKWEFLGGAALKSRVDTDEVFVEGVAYSDAATPVNVTTPLAGDYEYMVTAEIYVSAAAANAQASVGLGIGGASPAAPDVVQSTTQAGNGETLTKNGELINIAANVVVKLLYNLPTAAGGTAHTRWRILQMRPIRVG